MQPLASIPKVLLPRDIYKLLPRWQCIAAILTTSNSHFHHAWAAELLLCREMLPSSSSCCCCCVHPSQPSWEHWSKGQPTPTRLFCLYSDVWIYLIFFPILLILLHSWHWSYFILRAQKSVMEDLDGSASLYFYWSVSESTFTMITITSFSWISSAYLASLIMQRNWWIGCCFTNKC